MLAAAVLMMKFPVYPTRVTRVHHTSKGVCPTQWKRMDIKCPCQRRGGQNCFHFILPTCLPQSGLQQFRAASPLKLVSGCTASFAEAAVLKVPAECCERNVLIWNLAWILQAVASANVFCLAMASPFVSFCLPGVWDQLSLLVVLWAHREVSRIRFGEP